MASLPKKQRTELCQLEKFVGWCEKNEFNMNRKVKVKANGTVVAEYGMIAVEGLTQGEELFRIPRSVLIQPHTSSISKVLEENKERLESDSGWVPLLITLMYEYTWNDSFWRPYLDVCIDHHTFNLPMFWSSQQLEQLKGTGIIEEVNRDLKNIEHEFSTIVLPFMKDNTSLFNEKHTLELYKKMVAFVMSYSFSEPEEEGNGTSPPMMVPMADMLNHVSKNNACLQFEKDCLKMVTTREIHAREEVYNTYGELPNGHLLHMYGFAEKPSENCYDVVEFTSSDLFEQAKCLKDPKIELFDKKVELLGTDDVFVVGKEGILTEDEIHQTLKIIFMSAKEFLIYRENDGWVSDEEDDINFNFDHLKYLPSTWRMLLASVSRQCLNRYYKADKEDVEVKDKVDCHSLYACYVRNGQTDILQKLVDSLSI